MNVAMRLAVSYDSAGPERNELISPAALRRPKTAVSPQRQMPRFTYVYILQSEADSNHFYVGRTQDLRARIQRHNSGQVRHTSKWRPWRIKTYLALSDSRRAVALERYLKSASGRAFIKKRL
jgi:putative endonuclease